MHRGFNRSALLKNPKLSNMRVAIQFFPLLIIAVVMIAIICFGCLAIAIHLLMKGRRLKKQIESVNGIRSEWRMESFTTQN